MNDSIQTEAILNKIKSFADEAHGEQLRKYSPERYIAHPIRVMETCKNYGSSLAVLSAALLHDVLEDTETHADEILEFLQMLLSPSEARKTLKLVVELTDVYTKENYPSWNRDKRKTMETKRLSKVSAAAQTIKYADILDNCREIIVHDPDFANRYLKECRSILNAADKGNRELRKRALDLVNGELKK